MDFAIALAPTQPWWLGVVGPARIDDVASTSVRMGCVLWAAALTSVSACRYEALSFACPKGQPGCDGDPCADVVCADGEVCVAGACNGAPALDGEPLVRAVHRNVELGVAVDAADPEGDLLTFYWSLRGACSEQDFETHRPALGLRVDAAEGETCLLVVHANDGHQDSNTVELTLEVLSGPAALVGGHVDAAHSPCIDGYDPSAVTEQGTAAAPFCALRDGLAAAADWGVYVRVSDATQRLHAGVVLPSAVVVEGGYIANDGAEWVRPLEARSLLVLDSGVALGVGDESPDGTAPATFIGFDLTRSESCDGVCDFFWISRGDLTLREVSMGTRADPLASQLFHEGASSARYTGLFVLGDCGEVGSGYAARGTSIVLDRVHFAAPSGGQRTFAVLANGALADVHLTVKDSVLEVGDADVEAAALSTSQLAEVIVERSVLRAKTDAPDLAGTGYGLRDGQATVVGCAADSSQCHGSLLVSVHDSIVEARGYTDATGLRALGTGALVLVQSHDPVLDQVRGLVVAEATQLAIGVRTVSVGAVALSGVSVVAETDSESEDVDDNWALGLFDGWSWDDPVSGDVVFGGGATTLEVHGGKLVAQRRDPGQVTAGVMALASYATGSVVVDGGSWLQAREAEPLADRLVVPVERMAALWTVRARNVAARGSTMLVGEHPHHVWGDLEVGEAQYPRALHHVAAVYDRGPGSEESIGTSFVLDDCEVHAALGFAAEAWTDGTEWYHNASEFLRGAVVVRHRAAPVVSRSVVTARRASHRDLDGVLGGDNMVSIEPALHGILTRNTSNAQLIDNEVRVEALGSPWPEMIVAGVADGFRDAAWDTGTLADGSWSPLIDRNRVWVSAPRARSGGDGTLHGLWLADSGGPAIVTNNYIGVWGSDRIVGVHLDHVQTELAFNTLRLARCEGAVCPAPATATTGTRPGTYDRQARGQLEPYAVGLYGLDLEEAHSGGGTCYAKATNNLLAFEVDIAQAEPGIGWGIIDDTYSTQAFGFTLVAGNLIAPARFGSTHVAYGHAGGGETYGLPLVPASSTRDDDFCGAWSLGSALHSTCRDVFPLACNNSATSLLLAFEGDSKPGDVAPWMLGPNAGALDQACASHGLQVVVDITGDKRLQVQTGPLDVGAYELPTVVAPSP